MAGTVSAKTDRLEGIVDFTEQQVGLECFFWIDFDPLALSDKGTFFLTSCNVCAGSPGKSEHLELQHKQADGLGDEDHPPHQQGGDGEITEEFTECVFLNEMF